MTDVLKPARQYWSIDHEREWLASALALLTTPNEKMRFVRNYLSSLTRRYMAFDGQGPMDSAEYREMETFCLHKLYELEHSV